MKKNLAIFICIIINAVLLNAQTPFNCFSHDVYTKQLLEDPQFKKNQEQLEIETQAFLLNQNKFKPSAATYIIPVVFHVVYTSPAGNISTAQIQDQINILNKEFNRLQADTALTPTAFKPFAAPFSVEFRLATKDPNGNCSNGINRVYSTLTNCSFNENDVKSVSYWPSNKYLNIWITQTMHYSGSFTCDGGGYAQFPGGSAFTDGINIRGDLISNIGTAATNSLWGNFKGRYLIHELGHWFNLRHIWGDATCGNDLVADTPPAVFSNNGCPAFPRNANNSCGSGPSGEMFTNYMDYTDGPCLNMFTAGQVARMTAAINSPVSGRSNLWSQTNLNATGTNNPYTYPVACAAVPDILPKTPMVVCVGDSVRFTDNSYGGNITSRLWDFNGEPATSLTDSLVKVKYTVPGIYSLSLTTNNSNSTKTTVFNNHVHVLDNNPPTKYIVPFEDSFENLTDFSSEWTIMNRDNNLVTWEHNTSTAFTGDNCIALNNFNNMAPTTDDVFSPAYDLSAVENPTLNFRLCYTSKTNRNYDQLQVFISKNCGLTWSSVYQKGSNNGLRTISAFQVASFTPAVGSSDWRKEQIILNPLMTNGIVRFRFTFTSGGGNNIFLDDINVDGFNTTGLKNNLANNLFRYYPNPTSNELVVKIDSKNNTISKITIQDILGREILLNENRTNNLEETSIKLNTIDLKDGIYFINVKQNNKTVYTGKFIKKSD
jgi:hypothetical protein